jgi:hypothetical protein
MYSAIFCHFSTGNSAYWGLYELREKTDAEMFALSENANPNTIGILSSPSQYGFTLRAKTWRVQPWSRPKNDEISQIGTLPKVGINLPNGIFILLFFCTANKSGTYLKNTPPAPIVQIKIRRFSQTTTLNFIHYEICFHNFCPAPVRHLPARSIRAGANDQ